MRCREKRPVSKRPVGANSDRGAGQCQMAAIPLQTHTTLPRQENRFAQNCTPRTARLDWWKRHVGRGDLPSDGPLPRRSSKSTSTSSKSCTFPSTSKTEKNIEVTQHHPNVVDGNSVPRATITGWSVAERFGDSVHSSRQWPIPCWRTPKPHLDHLPAETAMPDGSGQLDRADPRFAPCDYVHWLDRHCASLSQSPACVHCDRPREPL